MKTFYRIYRSKKYGHGKKWELFEDSIGNYSDALMKYAEIHNEDNVGYETWEYKYKLTYVTIQEILEDICLPVGDL